MPETKANQVTDTVDLVKAYARQELVEPLRGAGRWMAMGAIGAVFLGLGLILLLVGLLRLLQRQSWFDGNWSFVPYVIVLVVCGAITAIVLSRIQKGSLHGKGSRR